MNIVLYIINWQLINVGRQYIEWFVVHDHNWRDVPRNVEVIITEPVWTSYEINVQLQKESRRTYVYRIINKSAPTEPNQKKKKSQYRLGKRAEKALKNLHRIFVKPDEHRTSRTRMLPVGTDVEMDYFYTRQAHSTRCCARAFVVRPRDDDRVVSRAVHRP
jgi:hypothetical protein